MTQRYEPPASSYPPARRRWGLVRPRRGRMIAGVCAGVADRFGMSRGLVRLLFVLSILLPGPQFLFYLAAWILVPSE
jgi:phage shock protein PspC (stress-responsive transcriptional regulator)